MRILLASIYHHSWLYGGNEHYTHNLALGLSAAGHSVMYATAFAKPMHKEKKYHLRIIPTPTVAGKPLPSLKWLAPLAREEFDIFHATGSGLPLLSLAFAYRRKRKLPTVLTYQAPTNPTQLLLKWGAQVESSLVPSCFSGLITTSPQNQKKLSKLFPRTKCFFVPLMLSPEFLNFKPSKKADRKYCRFLPQITYLLFVGQLDSHHYYKGLSVLIEAVKKLPQSYHLIIAGQGEQQPVFEQQVKEGGLTPRVKFMGQIGHDTLPTLMSAADALILPSINNSEGFGMVLLEAMSCHTPTITTTTVGAAPYFKKHQVTTLTIPKDPPSLTQAILQVVNQPNYEMVERASRFARSHALVEMVNKTLDVYKNMGVHRV